ncbi:nicotinate-nucleotide--dimethylbenzimidazole phosphoribosyltransferase, partial [Pseudomonas aeruginosa]|uniref:nicotinate-nucleotide--dimethylbenzimidazole phosphoribosyltransferase n=1 Tax=Pseudomonas aeruginosa TaxID=287 RepID=UPI003CC5FDDF
AHGPHASETPRVLGGLELAGVGGEFLACELIGFVALVDGYICSVAALCAVRLNDDCRDCLVFAVRCE